MRSREDYVGRCRGFVISHSAGLDPADVDWAVHLIDHDEPAKGLCSLAWALDREGRILAEPDLAALVNLLAGLVPTDALPTWVRSTP